MVADIPRLSITGFFVLAHLIEEGEVLHVAGPYLEDVGVSRHQFHIMRGEHLGDERQASLGTSQSQDFQPFLSQTAELVGGGTRLEGAAAQDISSSCFDCLCCFYDLLFCLHSAGAGDYDQVVTTDDNIANLDLSILTLKLAAGELVGLRNGDYFLDPGQEFEHIAQFRVCLPDHPDHSTFHSLRDVSGESGLGDLVL